MSVFNVLEVIPGCLDRTSSCLTVTLHWENQPLQKPEEPVQCHSFLNYRPDFLHFIQHFRAEILSRSIKY